MIAIRKAWWTAVVVAAFVGCSNEEPTGTNPAAPPPVPPGTTSMPPVKTDDAKPASTDEAKPAADAAADKKDMPKEKEEAPAPAIEAPAVSPAPSKPEAPKEKDAAPKEETKKDEAAAKTALSTDEIAEIEKLPAADRALALKQIVCPVSGEHLGSMDKPVKVSAEGKSFFLCCGGCDKDVKANPKAVVAKLHQN